MNLMITGACGHIGSYIAYNFAKKKNIKKIYLIDNFISSKINSLSNLKDKKFIFKRIDVSKNNSLNSIKNINTIIHCASLTNAEGSFKIKKLMYKNNLNCMKNIINYCIKKRINLIHLSSTSVYGSQENVVREDNIKFINPQSPYAKIKVIEENMLKKNTNKLRFITLRLGTIAGVSTGMRFHTAVNKFCLNASLNEKINIYKTAYNQYRPYLSLKDAFKGFDFFVSKKIFNNNTYNLLSKNYTVKQIIFIIKKYKNNLKIQFVKTKIMNQLSYKTETKKILKLGLKIKNFIPQDIKETLNYLKFKKR